VRGGEGKEREEEKEGEGAIAPPHKLFARPPGDWSTIAAFIQAYSALPSLCGSVQLVLVTVSATTGKETVSSA